jgi:putative ABC transport system ATP-binding protein
MSMTKGPASGVSPSAESPAIELKDVRFAYGAKEPVLNISGLTVPRGERVFLFGPSGSGKTTLLGLLAGVLVPQAGSVRVLGQEVSAYSGSDRDRFRAEHVGYIFQMFNLIPYLTVLDNIALPCRLSPSRRKRLGERGIVEAAREMAGRLGIAGLLAEPASNLSVGQQQRVAAARALIGDPELVIADEPTSALDADARERFIELLFERCADTNATLVLVSHDRRLADLFSQSVSLPEINRASTREANDAPALAGR